VCLVAIGAALRLYYIRQPMRYDESVTYLNFASQPWGTAIGSYTYPNNHVFHTLLVKAFATLLGNAPWVLRLPAFVAGVAMIPMAYAVGRRVFGSAAAHFGAALVAASGALALYSTNARGYTIVCLATLILADLLLRLRERPSATLWIATVLVMALGAWTIPVMLFPAGGLALWFALSALAEDTSARRGDLARFALAIIATTILAVLLYAPIIAGDGWSALAGNSFVSASAWRVFFSQLSLSITLLRASWAVGYPVAIWVLVGALAIVGLIHERKTSGIRVSIAGSVYVWCAFVLLVTHRAPFARVWLFLLAPVALFAGHGLIRLASVRSEVEQRVVPRAGELSVALAIGLAIVVLVSGDIEKSRDTGTLRDADRIAQALSRALRPGDRVFAPLPSNAPLAYAFLRAGVDTAYLSTEPGDLSRAYLIINTAEGFALNTSLSDPLLRRFQKARLMARYPSAEVYQLH
jgi:4-amino-4-deoxy-L-arabinose transferase-like glycosyltransferase